MEIQAIFLLFAAGVFAGGSGWECYKRSEKFRNDHAELPEGSDPDYIFSYCPEANGCCANGKAWYPCNSTCVPGNSCVGFNNTAFC
ncbi:hypothetical protein COCCADRAFT_41803 [Bipolaris zeicola 26-R-13]|uniref:Uncharacterized protein n=1 Tax=Cochliobolus carbonum (strain 26-R-13) TaxID=930089 RepID=W6XQ98_COCC2|nr:uncharacterized protein COCCADRAFT_41803 [Bipolaris zeicola 26-R-13]EUC27480.1 hypothetical protein COCCADRAFT_41803 [Bipolaris zeicola 26-R-13]